MCFSAGASFSASAVLAVTGVVSMQRAKGRQRWYAAIPLVFSVQQLLEGFQWLVLPSTYLSNILGYGFLFFAFLLWPVYTPLAIYFMEPQPARRRILRWLIYLGGAVSLALFSVLARQPLFVCSVASHIDYRINIPFSSVIGAGYALATCGSILLSSRKGVKIFGLLAFLGLIFAIIYAKLALTSVWCFVAAILSGLVLVQVSWGDRWMEKISPILKKKLKSNRLYKKIKKRS